MKPLNQVTVLWTLVEDTVTRESVCLCQAYPSDLFPPQKIIHHSLVRSSKCRSGPTGKKKAAHHSLRPHISLNITKCYFSPLCNSTSVKLLCRFGMCGTSRTFFSAIKYFNKVSPPSKTVVGKSLRSNLNHFHPA